MAMTQSTNSAQPSPLLENPLISVVTPVYNGEAHIAECIESVLAQDYTNFEFIILNNASTDGTADILETFARQDSRIRIERNDALLPIMENWNHAVSLISNKSNYCKVLHADDLLLTGALRDFATTAANFPNATLIGAYRIEGVGVSMDSIPYPQQLVPGRELARALLKNQRFRDQFGSPTSVMYRADCVRDTAEFYDPSNFHADQQVCFDLLAKGDYAFVHKALTYTRRHDGAETPQAKAMHTHALGFLKTLRRKGPLFLTAAELEEATHLRLRAYYRRLARGLAFVRNKKFRDYHMEGLRSIGLKFSPLRFAYAAFFEALIRVVGWLRKFG